MPPLPPSGYASADGANYGAPSSMKLIKVMAKDRNRRPDLQFCIWYDDASTFER